MANKAYTSITKSGVTLKDGKIEGYAAVFYDGTPDTEYQIGPNTFERIDPKCEITFADDVICDFDHNKQDYLARSRNGTLVLSIDKKGVPYQADVANTTIGNDVKALASRPGDIEGSSILFYDGPGESQYRTYRDGNKNIRSYYKLKIHRVSPVYTPAYKAAVRSKEEYRSDEERSAEILKEIEAQEALQAKIKKIEELTR